MIDVPAPAKRCGRCMETRAIECFSPRSSRPGQYDSWCRVCRNESKREKRAHVRLASAPPAGMKRCPGCDGVKPLEDFPPYRSKPGPRCRPCLSAQKSAYYQAHRDEHRVRMRHYAQQHRQEISVYQRRYRAEHCAELTVKGRTYYQQNKAIISQKERQHRARFLNQIRLLARIRNNTKRFTEGTFTPEEWTALCERYDNRCLACNRTDLPLTVDHVIPLTKGGTNWISNIQPLCKPCNSKKKNRSTDYRPT